jgi:hypothetical protein
MLGSILVGVILFNNAVSLIHYTQDSNATISEADAFQYIASLGCGVFLFLFGLGFALFQLPNHFNIQDFLISAFIALLMPVFEILGLVPLWWIVLVFIPSIAIAIIWKLWKKNKLAKTIVWDDAGLYLLAVQKDEKNESDKN